MSNDYLGREIDTVAIRESFKDTKGRDLAISDEVLANIIVAAGKRWTDMEDADDPETVACDFLEKAEAEVAKVSVSDPGITVLVNKMDQEFHKELLACIDAVSKTKTTAVDMYAQFKRVYTLEELNSMPLPGTEEGHVGDNQRPDKIKTKDQTGKPITITWTNDFVSAMPEGKDFETKLDDIGKELKAAGSITWLKGKSKADIAALRSDFSGKRNALRSIVKRAINLHHQWQAVTGMPKVDCIWIPGSRSNGIQIPGEFGTGEYNENSVVVTKAPKPIWICPKGQPMNGREFSVTQFLAFDVSLALNGENGGTMADLVATAGRGSDDSGNGTGDGTDLPIEDAVTDMSLLVNFFNKRDNQLTILRRISNRAADPEGNDILENVGTLYLLLKPIYEKNKAAYSEVIQRDRSAVA